MILYELQCSNGHKFEAWFRSSATYDGQAKRGEVECPVCSETQVEKAPMAPSIASGKGKAKSGTGEEKRASTVARDILDAVGKVQDHIERHYDYVGDKFADEARAIHYGDAEEREICGEATHEEAADLIEEEIPVWRVPWRNRKDTN